MATGTTTANPEDRQPTPTSEDGWSNRRFPQMEVAGRAMYARVVAVSSRVVASPAIATTTSSPSVVGAPGVDGRLPEIRLQLGNPSTMAIDGGDNPSTIVDGSEIVIGIPIDDTGMVKVVRRVIVLSTIGASFYIVNFNVNLMRGLYDSSAGQDGTSLWAAVSSLLIELSIPACGYCGAVYNNRQLTCCFCSCNLFIAIVSIMSFIRLNIRTGEIDGQCEREQNAQQRRTCEVWTSNGTEKYIMLANTLVIVFIGCFAFWFGNSLYNRIAQDSSLPPPAPLVGEVISLTSTTAAIGATGEPLQAAVVGSDGAAAVVSQESPGQEDIAETADAVPPDRPAQVAEGASAPDGNGSGPAATTTAVANDSGSAHRVRTLSSAQPRPAPGDDAPVGTDQA